MSGCRTSSDTTSPSNDAKAIQLQLNWIPDAQHGGFYEALEGGHYDQLGLNVMITPGGPGTPVIHS